MRCLSFLEIMNKNNQIIIISFSDIYRQQHFYEELKENNQEDFIWDFIWIEAAGMEGCNCYCDDMAAEMIREKALRCLEEEIPHGIAVAIDRMRERPDGSMMDIDATIICERDSHKGIIIGKGGAMLRKIGSQARREIENMLEMKVNLQLWVKVKKDWRDSDFMIKNFGYDKKEI